MTSRDFLLYYLRDVNKVRVIDVVYSGYFSSFGTSGSVLSNAVDMGKWIQFQLNEGVAPDGTEILTDVQFRGETQEHDVMTRTEAVLVSGHSCSADSTHSQSHVGATRASGDVRASHEVLGLVGRRRRTEASSKSSTEET